MNQQDLILRIIFDAEDPQKTIIKTNIGNNFGQEGEKVVWQKDRIHKILEEYISSQLGKFKEDDKKICKDKKKYRLIFGIQASDGGDTITSVKNDPGKKRWIANRILWLCRNLKKIKIQELRQDDEYYIFYKIKPVEHVLIFREFQNENFYEAWLEEEGRDAIIEKEGLSWKECKEFLNGVDIFAKVGKEVDYPIVDKKTGEIKKELIIDRSPLSRGFGSWLPSND